MTENVQQKVTKKTSHTYKTSGTCKIRMLKPAYSGPKSLKILKKTSIHLKPLSNWYMVAPPLINKKHAKHFTETYTEFMRNLLSCAVLIISKIHREFYFQLKMALQHPERIISSEVLSLKSSLRFPFYCIIIPLVGLVCECTYISLSVGMYHLMSQQHLRDQSILTTYMLTQKPKLSFSRTHRTQTSCQPVLAQNL